MSLFKKTYNFLTKSKSTPSDFSDHYDCDNDPCGVLEAEEWGEISDRLIKCSLDEECPQHPQALFWIAADILSEWQCLDDNHPNYDLEDPEFKRGLSLLQKAHKVGNIYASNELGLLYLEQNHMRDLELATFYLEKAFNESDPLSAYNLARVAHQKDPLNHRPVLEYLKFAAKNDQEDYEVSYFLALHAFGTEEERSNAAQYIRENKKACSALRNRVGVHFDLSQSALSPNEHLIGLSKAFRARFHRSKHP